MSLEWEHLLNSLHKLAKEEADNRRKEYNAAMVYPLYDECEIGEVHNAYSKAFAIQTQIESIMASVLITQE